MVRMQRFLMQLKVMRLYQLHRLAQSYLQDQSGNKFNFDLLTIKDYGDMVLAGWTRVLQKAGRLA